MTATSAAQPTARSRASVEWVVGEGFLVGGGGLFSSKGLGQA
jgi:hypothetical protein